MSFSLTSKFLANARGFTFTDSASVTWSINANTNAISATSSGGGGGSGTVTSVGLADTSTTPIFVVSNTPVTVSGTIDITLGTQTAKTFFAGPTSGGAAQPTFRVIAAADVPTLNQNTSGSSGSCTGNAATATSATSATSATTATTATNIAGGANGSLPYQTGAGATSLLAAGSTGNVLTVAGGIPSWAAPAAVGANPTGTIGLAAVNGAATTFVRSDGAPALSQAIVPTWSGAHTFSALLTANLGITVAAAPVTLAAGTTTVQPLVFQSGTNLTSAAAGVAEYDGVSYYFTNETTAGRGLVPVEQIFHLAADGSGITTIANFFGTTSNIPLVSGGYYEIEIVLYYVMGATASVVTWTLTNSAAPTSMDLYYEMSPITGMVAPPGTATMLVGQILGGVTAAQTVVTGSLTGGKNQYARFRIMLKNGTGTSLKIQATETTQTTSLTPKIGSYWKCKRIPAGNVGTFAA